LIQSKDTIHIKKTEQVMPINDTSTITRNKISDVTVKHDSQ